MSECIDEAGVSNKMRPARSEWHVSVTFAHEPRRALAKPIIPRERRVPLVGHCGHHVIIAGGFIVPAGCDAISFFERNVHMQGHAKRVLISKEETTLVAGAGKLFRDC
jgi:hypothetical protein